jgi:hypothetical protein
MDFKIRTKGPQPRSKWRTAQKKGACASRENPPGIQKPDGEVVDDIDPRYSFDPLKR